MKRTIFCFICNLSLALWGICPFVVAQSYYDPRYSQQPTDWSGTGWMLNKGYVVTNQHVADNARTIILRFESDDSTLQYSGEVALMDEENDLAIIKINDPNFKGFGTLPYAIKTSLADVGENVFVLGYPMTSTMGDEIKLTNGIISSHSGFQGNKAEYQTSAPIQPGNSGGPLFDENGNIIGIVNAKHAGAENVSYAIKAIHLQELVNKLSDKTGVMPATNSISSLSLPQKVKKIKGFVCYIQCSTRGETPQSANPKYGAPSVPKGNKIVERPYVDYTTSENARVTKVTISDKETTIEFSINNETRGGYITGMHIEPDTKIVVDGQEYKMIRAEGIAVSPNTTQFTRNGETKTFKIIFPVIPKASTSINFIEPGENGWKFYGISLKEY